MNPDDLAELALEVATAAAAVALRGYRRQPTVSKKGRTDLVTEYDLASEALVRAELARRTPDATFVGEEGGGSERARGLVWACDPIDGTTNFAHGHPFWCVSLGALHEGVPVAGAVVAPALDVRWWGSSAGGAFRNRERCAVSRTEVLDDALLATGFPQDRATAPGNNLATFTHVKQRARGIRRCGSAALDLCLVADGTYDGYWERKLHLWDVAAGAALVLAAGGVITALDGGAPDYSVGSLIASNGRVHDELARAIAAAT